jgi:CelD/BcsL family acetyltransferase involved in cellulose biosynthesis
MNDIQIKEICTIEAFAKLRDDWNELLCRNNNRYFQFSFDWLYTWAKYASHDNEFLILTFWKSDKLIAIIPLTRLKYKTLNILPINTFTFLSNNFCDHSDLMLSENTEEVIELFLKYLKTNSTQWDRIIFKNIPEYSLSVSLLPAALDKMKFTYTLPDFKKYYYIDTRNRTFQDYYSTDTSKKFVRRDLNRITNMFGREGNFSIVRPFIDSSGMNLEESFQAIMSMHIDRQNDLKRTSMYEETPKKTFIREIYEFFHKKNELDITFLKFNEKLISYAVAFIINKQYFWWNTGFDTEYSKYSPTKLLLYHLIESCFERKLEMFSFMRGESEYKEKWTKTYYKGYDIIIENHFNIKPILIRKLKNIRTRV